MQAVIETSAMPRASVLFARRHGRDYMMRSEKRNGYNYGSSPSGGKKPKRKRAGFFYILFTLLLSVIFWPAGMIMLWQRKLRWKAATKLLTSLLTLILCVTLFGFALTVQTENPDFTRVQDTVNDFLDDAVVEIGNAYSLICEKAVEVAESASDLGGAAGQYGMNLLADGLDKGVELTGNARDAVTEWWLAEDLTFPGTTPEPDASAGPEATEPAAKTPAATASSEITAPAAEATDASDVPPADNSVTIEVPETTPDIDTAEPIGEGTLTRDRELLTNAPTEVPTEAPEITDAPEATVEATKAAVAATTSATATPATVTNAPTEAPTATPEPTDAPTPAPTETPVLTDDLLPKPVGELVVYYNDSGVNYHWRSTCKGMTTAKAGTLADAVEKGLRRCKNCDTPDASVLEIENAVWTDENSHFHLSDECTEFMGNMTILSLTDATENGYLPCVSCKSGLYMTALGVALPTPTPEPTPTPSPTPEPTPTPAPETITPAATLKPASQAMLYHSSNSGWYHTIHNCSGMGGAKLYTFESCVDDGLKYCKKCGSPKPELLDEHCLWLDEQEICHTSDECAAFSGDWTLVPRDDALAEGYTGCADCGAGEYLIENTIIAYPQD